VRGIRNYLPNEARRRNISSTGVTELDVNRALQAVPKELLAHASSYGSVTLSYTYSSGGHVMASVLTSDVPHSVSFVYMMSEMTMMESPSVQALDAVWWQHDPGVTGFLFVSNTTGAARNVDLTYLDGLGKTIQTTHLALSGYSTRLLDLPIQNAAKETQRSGIGGIKMSYVGVPGDVSAAGGLINEGEGYSANISFWPHDIASSSPTNISYGIAGMMVGTPDPMMMFSSTTRFVPYLAREGLVGHTTGCGHVILTNDHFVALPATGLCNVGVRLAKGATKVNTTVLDVGPWCPNTPGPGNSNPCNCGSDRYWQTTGVPWCVNQSCSSDHAGIDLADGTAADLGVSGLGNIYWRFQ